MSVDDFFDKCINGTLVTSDFIIGDKNAVHSKMKAMEHWGTLLHSPLMAEEDFPKNKKWNNACSLCASNGIAAIGYVKTATGLNLPKTLLHKAKLTKVVTVNFVLRRNRGDSQFDVVVQVNL